MADIYVYVNIGVMVVSLFLFFLRLSTNNDIIRCDSKQSKTITFYLAAFIIDILITFITNAFLLLLSYYFKKMNHHKTPTLQNTRGLNETRRWHHEILDIGHVHDGALLHAWECAVRKSWERLASKILFPALQRFLSDVTLGMTFPLVTSLVSYGFYSEVMAAYLPYLLR